MCCAYGMIIFSEERHSDHRALGVKILVISKKAKGEAEDGYKVGPLPKKTSYE